MRRPKPSGTRTERVLLNLNELPMEEGRESYIDLMKDFKSISRTFCIDSPIKVPSCWNIYDIRRISTSSLTKLPHFRLSPACQDESQKKEWMSFTSFLYRNKKAALVRHESGRFYILPPKVLTKSIDLVVSYQCKSGTSGPSETFMESKHVGCSKNSMKMAEVRESVQSGMVASTACRNAETVAQSKEVATPISIMSEEMGQSFHENVKDGERNMGAVKHSPYVQCEHTVRGRNLCDAFDRFSPTSRIMEPKQDNHVAKNYVRADPSFLTTLGQTHSGWIFGAIAELVDNSRDARASKLEISVDTLYSKRDAKEIPVLSVIDDGHGMSHADIVRMLSFGRRAPDVDDLDRIGRFGIGFKTGAMRIGRDAVVLTQTSKSRSIAFLSQSLNEVKDNVEIPIVSYCRQGSVMEVDTSAQSEASADYHLKVIKEFSPFNEYLIGEKLAKFCDKGTGTQIYIWNLDEWGSNYCLEWQNGKSSSHVADILIRSRRIRLRPGQISQKVPLDYSLRSYLEVIFLDPRMKIYVQRSRVNCHPLAKSLNKTTIINDNIMGKSVQLTLGRSQLEWEQMNCGIFLFWHGRLIEAYKKVGSMAHNADMGRGVIGVIDVTDMMNDGKRVWVHNDKQGFLDCEAYAKLEEWLGRKADEYWDNNFDPVEVTRSNERYEPDHEWVQCDKCRKWRILASGFDSSTLSKEWFCYMPPYNGKCEIPEQEVDHDVVTVAAQRSGCNTKPKDDLCAGTGKEVHMKHLLEDSDCSSQTMENARPVVKQNARPILKLNACPPKEENARPVLRRLRRGSFKV